MTEGQIERRLVGAVRGHGGMCLKFVSPGSAGVPDRIVIIPGGRIIFVELKTERGRLSEIQRWQIQEMRERGADVRVLRGADEVDRFIDELKGRQTN